ncbi:MAG: adenosylmethionine decarboxylase [Anaerolineae bacterium]|nr:adenosylmethionine decarboxylase [Anaerolineae bacterium]
MEAEKHPQVILGRHAIYDLSGCDAEIINNPQRLNAILHDTADVAKITVLGVQEHYFDPQGYSAVLILEESHLSLHTWPEHLYISVDLYSCSLNTDFEAVRDYLVDQLQAMSVRYLLIERGPFDQKTAISPVSFAHSNL